MAVAQAAQHWNLPGRAVLRLVRVEPLVPPYMDARDLAKSDPQNYEVRALHAADQVRAIIAAERIELAKLKSDIAAALKAIAEYDSELVNQRERHEAVATDAERRRCVVTHCKWIRHDYGGSEKYSSMSVRLPFDADQSCVATRTAAIDTAIKEMPRLYVTKSDKRRPLVRPAGRRRPPPPRCEAGNRVR